MDGFEDDEDEIIAHFSGKPTPPKTEDAVDETEQLKRAFQYVMNFPAGVTAMRHIMKLTGYDDIVMRFNPETKELNAHTTLYNVSRHDLWVCIRELLTPQQRAVIESEDQPWQMENKRRAADREVRQQLRKLGLL